MFIFTTELDTKFSPLSTESFTEIVKTTWGTIKKYDFHLA